MHQFIFFLQCIAIQNLPQGNNTQSRILAGSELSWDRFPGRLPWKRKELVSAVSFSRTFLDAQKQFLPFKGKESRWNKRLPWLRCELLSLLKTEREAYQRWKTLWELQGHCQGEQMKLQKQKLCSNWNWLERSKNPRKVLQVHKQQTEGNTGSLICSRGELVTHNAERAEVSSTFFTSVFTLGHRSRDQKSRFIQTLSLKEELVCELSQEPDLYKLLLNVQGF